MFIWFCLFLLLILINFNVFLIDFIYNYQVNSYSLVDLFKLRSGCVGNYFCCFVLNIFAFVLTVFLSKYLVLQLFIFVIFIFSNLFIQITKFKECVFKFTARVWRLIFVNYLLFFVLIFLIFKLFNFNFIFLYYSCLIILNIIPIISVIITLPIEMLIGYYYIYKSKRKLNSCRGLIKIGVTGSFGKTSTKVILNSLLSEKYNVLATPKSFNTPLGISKSINMNLNPVHEIFICEMGAKKCGEIKALCKQVQVDIGVVTSVGRQHTNTFGSIENIYMTKRELPDSLSGKFCVFNLMNLYVARMYDNFRYKKIGCFYLTSRKIKNTKVLLKGLSFNSFKFARGFTGRYCEFLKKDNVYAKNIILTSMGSSFDIYYDYKFICRASLNLLGSHNILNTLLSVAVAIHLDLSSSMIFRGISKIQNIDARLERFDLSNGAVVINNGYNSNIDSAKSTLSCLNLFDTKYKFIITPGLIDCEDMYQMNYDFAKIVAKYATNIVIVKNINKKAMVDALNDVSFDMSKVQFVDDFNSARQLFDGMNSDYVVLIENDLPDNFK